MSSSYAGVTFSVETPGTWLGLWEPDPRISVRPYPYSNRVDRQWGGFGLETRQCRVQLDDETDYNTLKAAIGITARTLVLVGTTITGVELHNVTRPQRHANGEVYCELEFARSSP